MKPDTQYARSGDVFIAYQIVGEGPFDFVLAPGQVSNIEYGWKLPRWARFYGSLAEFSRAILLDKRGTGVSDPVVGAPSLEERMDDIRAVMDAAGSTRAALYGAVDGASLALLFAATYPERTAALVLWSPLARAAWAPDHPWGRREVRLAEWFGERFASRGHAAASLEGSRLAADPEFLEWWLSYMRLSVSPSTYEALARLTHQIDVRHVLPSIRVSTLVLHRPSRTFGGIAPTEESRYVASRIAGAQYVELPPGEGPPWADEPEPVLRPIREFLTALWEQGAWQETEPERVLTTILFTDIVGSTTKAAEVGDARWRDILAAHHAVIRRHLARFRGREIDTAGDGFFASFDGPARAIRCAGAIAEAVRELGLETRAGVHTGECEVVDDKVAGIAVHIGARVAARAGPGEVLVSSTVKDLVAGAGIEFEARGSTELKGVSGEWRLFAVRG